MGNIKRTMRNIFWPSMKYTDFKQFSSQLEVYQPQAYYFNPSLTFNYYEHRISNWFPLHCMSYGSDTLWLFDQYLLLLPSFHADLQCTRLCTISIMHSIMLRLMLRLLNQSREQNVKQDQRSILLSGILFQWLFIGYN